MLPCAGIAIETFWELFIWWLFDIFLVSHDLDHDKIRPLQLNMYLLRFVRGLSRK